MPSLGKRSSGAEQPDNGENTLKPSAVKLKGERLYRHETWRDVYAFFCCSNIQIMKQARCSSNPLRTRRNGMVQSPRKYVTQIRKHGGKRRTSACAFQTAKCECAFMPLFLEMTCTEC